MEFNSNKSIYLQIAESLCEKILSGEIGDEDRIPSVREYAVAMGVNPNTVMRSYEKLTSDEIIYNKRGIGYYVAPGARGKVLESQRKEFLEQDWPVISRRIRLLGIDIHELE